MNAIVKHEGVQAPSLREEEFSLIEQVVMQGDLSKLNPEQRVMYYRKVCDSAGLNPYTRPFDYILLNGKLTLYAKKDCTEQLRKLNGISIVSLEDKMVDDIYIVTAKAEDKNGRIDQAKGAVVIAGLKGDAKANAIMKAETKAKRRVTLSICGMGFTDESEIDSIPHAKHMDVDALTGEIKVSPTKELTEYITHDQREKIEMLLSLCNPDKLTKIIEALKRKSGGKGYEFIQKECYAKIESFLSEQANKYQESLKQIEVNDATS